MTSLNPLRTVASISALILLAACNGNNNPPAPPAAPPPTLGSFPTTLLPTGQTISPTASPGSVYANLNPGLVDNPDYLAGQAVSEALSPDGKTLLVLTSGYNNVVDANGGLIKNESNEYVFVFDVTSGKPVQRQALQIPDTYVGIAFAPDGKSFYVSGGGDDNLHSFTSSAGGWAESGTAIALGHSAGNGLAQGPLATGLAITADGMRAVVANRYNDSVTLVDLVGRTVIGDVDLRPGKSGGTAGTAGGEYPDAVQILGSKTAYISSERDREVVVVDISQTPAAVTARIPVQGNPNKMLLDRSQSHLYVASDNADLVSVIATASNTVTSTIPTVAPAGLLTKANYRGASPNGLGLSPDGSTLYVTNRGTNSLAVIALDPSGAGSVSGLVPTGWYPSDVVTSADGGTLFVVNTKGLAGPNRGNCLGYGTNPCPVAGSPVQHVQNEYVLQLHKAGLLTVPKPNAGVLGLLTQQVATNNGFNSAPASADAATMAAVRAKVQHVIYIIKENRTYDQILGDLPVGNGDPSIAEFPAATTPNLHAMASNFVALDNFYDAGDVSGDGWPWSTSARESDASAKMLSVNYALSPVNPAGRGGSYDWEGTNRNVNVGLAGDARTAANPLSASLDADTLPGTGNVAAPDGPGGEVQQGYLWNSALRAGLSVRNYGQFIDLTRYSLANTPYAALQIPRDRTPFASGIVQAYSANPDLASLTDPYFRGFDDAYPDYYREQEWEREFADYVTGNNLPALSLVRLMADHTGSYAAAIDGVNTPEIQVADNDYAVGRLVAAVANSPYAANTLIFVVEDDAQDGPDHVDAHRSTFYLVGPYVKQHALVTTHYTTVNVLRTITDVLGIDHLGLLDASQGPMADLFDLAQSSWSFTARPSSLLKSTQLPIAASEFPSGLALKPTHSARYWARLTRDMDFAEEDKLDAVRYNQLLWKGLMGSQRYPSARSGKDLRAGRAGVRLMPANATVVSALGQRAVD